MAAPRYKKLGELLLEARAIDEGQLRNAQAHQRQWGGRLGRILVELKFIDEASLAMALAKQLGLESVRLSEADIDPAIVQLLPQVLAERHWVFPLRYWEREAGVGELAVAIADPTNLAAADEIRFQTGKKVHLVVALEGEIAQAIRRYYYGEQEPVPQVGEIVANRKEIFAPKGTFLSDPGEEDLAELQPLDVDAGLTPVPRPGLPVAPPKGVPLGAFAKRPATVPPATPRTATPAAMRAAPPAPARPATLAPPAFDLGALADHLAPMISDAKAATSASNPQGRVPSPGNGSAQGSAAPFAAERPRESITSELAALTDPGPTTADEAAPAEVVRPNQLVSALVRILIRKGVFAEAELMEELSRR